MTSEVSESMSSSPRTAGVDPLSSPPPEEGEGQGDVLAVPGFGFLPRWFLAQLESHSEEMGVGAINDTWLRNSAKCQIVEFLFGQGVFPSSAGSDPPAAMCPPLFDNASCYPATPAGRLMEIPCMEEYHGIRFNTSGKGIARPARVVNSRRASLPGLLLFQCHTRL